MSCMLYGFGALSEMLAPLLSAFFFVPMAVSVSINAVIGALILGFKSLPGPF